MAPWQQQQHLAFRECVRNVNPPPQPRPTEAEAGVGLSSSPGESEAWLLHEAFFAPNLFLLRLFVFYLTFINNLYFKQ
jgi:hypothetical protein